MNCPNCHKEMDRVQDIPKQPWINCYYCWNCKIAVPIIPMEKVK